MRWRSYRMTLANLATLPVLPALPVLSVLSVLSFALATPCSAQPHHAATEQARVVDVRALTERETLPQEVCQPLGAGGQERCRIHQRTTERIRAYHVTYEYQGQWHSGELSYHPGEWVTIALPAPAHSPRSHSSQRSDSGLNASLQPGRKHYGSAPATGSSTTAIEYRSPQPEIPILVDLRATLTPSQAGVQQPQAPRPPR